MFILLSNIFLFSMSINKVILVGFVGQGQQITKTQQGNKIANFSFATSDTWKDKQTGERKSKTEWHKVVVFNENIVNLIEKYVVKGSKLYIEGSLQTRKWTDKKTNEEKYTTEIILQGYSCRLEILDKKDDNAEEEKSTKKSNAKKQEMEDDENFDEVPF